INKTQLSAADGSYSFQGLRPGIYNVSETQPSGYLQGHNNLGSEGGTLSADQFLGIFLPQSTAGANYDFGETLPASISGYVYVDNNNNSVKNSGEPPIPNTTIILTGKDDLGNPVSQTKLTGTDGSYSFQDLRPGTYTVAETQPS